MIIRMGCQQFGVTSNNGFLASLLVLNHILVWSGTFIETPGDVTEPESFFSWPITIIGIARATTRAIRKTDL